MRPRASRARMRRRASVVQADAPSRSRARRGRGARARRDERAPRRAARRASRSTSEPSRPGVPRPTTGRTAVPRRHNSSSSSQTGRPGRASWKARRTSRFLAKRCIPHVPAGRSASHALATPTAPEMVLGKVRCPSGTRAPRKSATGRPLSRRRDPRDAEWRKLLASTADTPEPDDEALPR